MDQISSFSLIIPAYNEEKRLPKTLKQLTKWFKKVNFDLETLIIDDGSTDRTYEIAKNFAQKEKRVQIMKSQKNLGKMPQFLKGFKLAKNEIVGVMDADGAADPQEFSRLFPELKEADIVMGSRYLRDSLPPISGKPLFAKLVSRGSITLFRLLFKVPLYDTQIGFKIYKRSILKNIIPLVSRKDGFIDTEIIVKAFGLGYKLEEIPIKYRHASAHSKINRLMAIVPSISALISLWYDSYNLFQQKKLKYNPVRWCFILNFFYHLGEK